MQTIDNNNVRVSEIGNQDNYNDDERLIICNLSNALRSRDLPYARGVPPTCYMKLYSKAAAAIFQCAKHLAMCEVYPGVEPRGIHHWIQVLSAAGFGGSVQTNTDSWPDFIPVKAIEDHTETQ